MPLIYKAGLLAPKEGVDTKATKYLTSRLRASRAATRRSRAINRALVGASPALRDELLEISKDL
jgi:hypothetical protein